MAPKIVSTFATLFSCYFFVTLFVNFFCNPVLYFSCRQVFKERAPSKRMALGVTREEKVWLEAQTGEREREGESACHRERERGARESVRERKRERKRGASERECVQHLHSILHSITWKEKITERIFRDSLDNCKIYHVNNSRNTLKNILFASKVPEKLRFSSKKVEKHTIFCRPGGRGNGTLLQPLWMPMIGKFNRV